MASQVSVSGTPGDASPGPATASVAATGPASIKDFSCPVVPRESRKVSRSRRTAVLLDSPPSLPTERVANPCPMPVHPPGDSGMR